MGAYLFVKEEYLATMVIPTTVTIDRNDTEGIRVKLDKTGKSR